jgi:CMP-N-acetylneuraminic acid synthetase
MRSNERSIESSRVLAVIPARGGSKRLPRKNIKKLLGRPLIDYTIKAAEKANLLTDVIFSTDDEEIRDIALECGAYSPILRPPELSGDHVRNSATMIHCLNYMENLTGKEYDCIVLLQPTSPLRDQFHIDEAVEKFITSDATSLAAVKGPYKKRDINLKRINGSKLENLIENNEEYYIYNASLYIVTRDWLLEKERFTSEDEIPYVMDDISSIDIDEELDFIMAQAAIEFREEGNAKI